ncbi:MAG TPA: hypothetical protein DCY07_03540 [Rhodospirillaceae bacterium]|nr:hypothetical protein [Rhodospirillaceae bacterium]
MAEFGRHILILVPHPDDEVVACAAMAVRAINQGATIHALYLTNGCIAKKELWPWQRWRYDAFVAQRRNEALAVAKRMKIIPAGFANRPSRYLWRNLPSVFDEITRAIATHDIDQLWVPAYEGGHADHDALNGACSLLRESVSILEFAEYNFYGGKANAQSFPFPNGSEERVQLTDAERAEKTALLKMYKSEKCNLGYVGVDHETYRPLALYDFARAPHGGKLWYTRYHWVPFAHPRIDFTTPAQVSDAIVNYTTPRT